MSIGFYSLQEAKDRLGKSEQELRNLARSGKLNVVEEDGALWFSAADVDELGGNDSDVMLTLEEVPEKEPVRPATPPEKKDVTDEKITLEPEDEVPPTSGMSKIRAFGLGGITGAKKDHDTSHLRRRLIQSEQAATRCRTFHAKLSDASLAYLDNQINEWIDTEPEVSIKFATSCIGVVEGKHAEPHLIVTLFY